MAEPNDSEGFTIDDLPKPATILGAEARLRYLRDFIARLPDEMFDMAVWGEINEKEATKTQMRRALKGQKHRCGTAGCLGGWTITLFGRRGDEMDDEGAAAELLGLTYEQGTSLFLPMYVRDLSQLTRVQALKTLDHLIETGVIKWNVDKDNQIHKPTLDNRE